MGLFRAGFDGRKQIPSGLAFGAFQNVEQATTPATIEVFGGPVRLIHFELDSDHGDEGIAIVLRVHEFHPVLVVAAQRRPGLLERIDRFFVSGARLGKPPHREKAIRQI